MSEIPFSEAAGVWWRVALHSFGGPAGQIAVIHRVVVEEKRWIDEAQFLRALGFCMLLPGPEAQQLATYLGWRLHGVRGGLTAGLLFVAPGFITILALSVLYLLYRDVSVVSAIFAGVKPAVLVIVLQAVWRLRARALRTPVDLGIAGAAFLAIFALDIPFPSILAAAAAVGVVVGGRDDKPEVRIAARPGLMAVARTAGTWLAIWLLPVAAIAVVAGPESVFMHEALFFSKAALVTFGGAYAVLAYIAQQAVDVYGWLGPGEMLDGLALAETTPGPLIMVVQFVGFLGAARHAGGMDPVLAGVVGSVITTWVTFAPCFLFIFTGAPFVEVITTDPRVRAALSGVTAAVVGVLLNLAMWFALNTFFVGSPRPMGIDPLAIAIFAATAVAAWRGVGMFGLLGLGGGAGILGLVLGMT